jgi:hypothetical protein
MSDLQKQEIYDQLYEEYQCINRIPLVLLGMQIAISLNDPKRNDQAAPAPASIMGLYKRLLEKKPRQSSSRIKRFLRC